MPEKSGMDAADCVPLSAGPIAGAATCPHAGVAAAAANVTDRRKTRCLYMTIPFVFARDALPRPFGSMLRPGPVAEARLHADFIGCTEPEADRVSQSTGSIITLRSPVFRCAERRRRCGHNNIDG